MGPPSKWEKLRRGGQQHKRPAPPHIHHHVTNSNAQPAEEFTTAVVSQPEPERTKPVIASVSEPQKESDQVYEPAPPCVA